MGKSTLSPLVGMPGSSIRVGNLPGGELYYELKFTCLP